MLLIVSCRLEDAFDVWFKHLLICSIAKCYHELISEQLPAVTCDQHNNTLHTLWVLVSEWLCYTMENSSKTKNQNRFVFNDPSRCCISFAHNSKACAAWVRGSEDLCQRFMPIRTWSTTILTNGQLTNIQRKHSRCLGQRNDTCQRKIAPADTWFQQRIGLSSKPVRSFHLAGTIRYCLGTFQVTAPFDIYETDRKWKTTGSSLGRAQSEIYRFSANKSLPRAMKLSSLQIIVRG